MLIFQVAVKYMKLILHPEDNNIAWFDEKLICFADKLTDLGFIFPIKYCIAVSQCFCFPRVICSLEYWTLQ